MIEKWHASCRIDVANDVRSCVQPNVEINHLDRVAGTRRRMCWVGKVVDCHWQRRLLCMQAKNRSTTMSCLKVKREKERKKGKCRKGPREIYLFATIIQCEGSQTISIYSIFGCKLCIIILCPLFI